MEVKNTDLKESEKEIIRSRASNTGTHYEVVFVSCKTKRKKPKVYESQVGYDFLQYRSIVYHWATKKYEITTKKLDLILFLYPQGPFSSTRFYSACKIHTIVCRRWFQEFQREGFIIVRRKAYPRKRQYALYCLSKKASDMCSRLHNILVGDEKIPDWANPLAAKDITANKYYMDHIKELNKRSEKRRELQKKEKAAE